MSETGFTKKNSTLDIWKAKTKMGVGSYHQVIFMFLFSAVEKSLKEGEILFHLLIFKDKKQTKKITKCKERS